MREARTGGHDTFRPRGAKALRTAGVTAVLIAVLGGCAARTAVPGPPPSGVPTPPAATPVSRLHLPIEVYLLPPAVSAVYDRVRGGLIHDCMHAFGLAYPAPPRTAPTPDELAAYTVTYRRYGITDPASVRVWGYRVPRPAHPATDPAAGVRLADLTPAARRVLLGVDPGTGAVVTREGGRTVPSHGCVGDADRRLGGGDTTSPQGPQSGPGGLVATIKQDSFQASRTDPRVTRVFTAWSACMRAAGYHVTDPLRAAAGLPAPRDGHPGHAEIAQATADVTCKTRTDLVGVWFAVESDYQNTAIHAHAAALDRVRADLDREAAALRELAPRYTG
ncbi:hypothetical protein [Streptantibioticus cattleyicolor]|uniref:Uncharacterized protein n=1 Tax=Streptantibioticus cattleyicolor (strain ATCC 35852 / DSM 46488 / JCM 4925 / NBRC 14057 / NRRL 8057) TaxID=1003195 RepID=F8JL81_STREN|nr:hypothetical protein [Streptantibioticus cattleyicolor]AEW98336.1 hypothetical protein SCATT_p01430 [Streptantibioticus cattleyicolor NRRL 8057 = DSM 46488]CCB72606.1 conserved exported protein of unknown function [Streptantibioticus cattleyicolor NRRL 8057 = DSM 46488]